MPYELIDHTADLGIAVTEQTLERLFETAGHAMFDQIVDRRSLKGLGKTRIRAGGMDLPDLMVNWLRELLFLWNGREYLVKQAIMESISESALTARIWYDPYTPGEHEIGTDIKAVTYHGLRVEKKEAGWEASVIFDV